MSLFSGLIRQNTGRVLSEMLGAEAGTEGEGEGDLIGPYRLCERLGEGGFGNVWRAEQTAPVRREVAVKVIKLGMDTMQVLARFNQERQALATLEHPNIAAMRDAGVSPYGRPYFAMELVRGGAITNWCEARQSPLTERLQLFIQVCQAVQHAHARGILHRDLKPSNILVAEVDGQPVPKIIDFGIAKAIRGGSLHESRTLTKEDQLLGTPLYMSPEQIEGEQELDARSDVYALGMILYELLTGMRPFGGAGLNMANIAAVRREITETVPERPSKRARRDTRAGKKRARAEAISADLDWITMRALEKDRERRYSTAADLAADVQRFLDRQAVLAGPPSVAYKASRWIQRHRTACACTLAGAALSCLALLLPKHLASIGRGPLPKPSSMPLAQIDTLSITNSLGMKLVAVPIVGGPTSGQRVLFSIWDTRVQDYETFIHETRRAWEKPRFEQGPTHPAVMVTWHDAQAFCAWLTERERKLGKIAPDQIYRLPSDHEWSCAAGIGDSENPGRSPTEKRAAQKNIFAWGLQWPPPDNSGNYLSAEAANLLATHHLHLSKGTPAKFPEYRDGFPATAPVGSYAPNRFGLYDMGGNVWNWCQDRYDSSDNMAVLRGGSWFDYDPASLRLAMRTRSKPAKPLEHYGFRCVLAAVTDSEVAASTKSPPIFPASMSRAEAEQRTVTNSLSMKFLPIPGSSVLFCIHETRRQDYAAFAAAEPGRAEDWKAVIRDGQPCGHGPDHPVIVVSWEEAQAFCAWLSRKEGRTYRLPTDEEWSTAAGIAALEKRSPGTTPSILVNTTAPSLIAGTEYPPRTSERPGNFADESWHRVFPKDPWIPGFQDGYPTTAPVMSFTPNRLGLYDLAGNADEWCADWFDFTQTTRTVRGGSYHARTRSQMLASFRWDSAPHRRYNGVGFRIVLEPPSN